MAFLGVPGLNSKALFDYWIVSILKHQHDVGIRRLRKLINATCLRRTKETVGDIIKLPLRTDIEELVIPSNEERQMHDFFKARVSGFIIGLLDQSNSKQHYQKPKSILQLINLLRRLCDHEELIPPNALRAWKNRDSIAAEEYLLSTSIQRCSHCNLELHECELAPSSGIELCSHRIICSDCSIAIPDNSELLKFRYCPVCADVDSNGSSSGSIRRSSREISTTVQPSSKMKEILKNIRLEQSQNCRNSGDKPIKRFVSTYCERNIR
jgi:SWI/SNF-related matrix-associated actin-dependent regulator of chromatin subfamily A3